MKEEENGRDVENTKQILNLKILETDLAGLKTDFPSNYQFLYIGKALGKTM